jgi:acyl-[acyl carrier protein]--UDP-N-acetylglucosamine O-acyltransferase
MKSLSSKTYQCGVTIEGLTTLAGITYLTGITNTTSWDHVIVGTTAQGQIYTRTYAQFMTDVATGIGLSGYVPTSRTLSINGTTYDLSANRSWTVPTIPVGGNTGDILAKNSATDYDVTWIPNYTSSVKHEVKLGENMTIGTPVYVSGSTGGSGTNMIVSKASNTSEPTSSKTMGLTASAGITNDQVFVVTEGLLSGINTSTAVAGDPVWLGPSGTLLFGLANKPYAPAHMVFLGVVTRVQSVNGEIFVKVQNGFELDELHDVAIASKANNDLLVYESATSLWKNKTFSAIFGGTPIVTMPTLAQVTTAGNTTTNSITVGTLNTSKLAGNTLIQGINASESAFSYKLYNSGSGTLNSAVFTQSLDYSGSTNGYISFTRGGGGTDGFLTFGDNGGERMRLAYGGNLGIGTTSPNSKLQVAGLSIFTNSVGNNYNENIRLPESSAGWSSIVMGGAIATGGTGLTVWSILKNPSGSGHRFGIMNNTTEYFTIFTSGNVSIGSTTDNGNKLNIQGTTRLGGNTVVNGSTEDASNTATLTVATTNTSLRLGGNTTYSWIQTHNSKPLYINELGNNTVLNLLGGSVGIGTASPSTKLDVNGVITATGGNSTNWNTAYSWGNHSSAGYVPQARTLTINGTTYDLSANRSWTIATTTPGGSNTQFQYNSSGTLAGASALTYDSTTNRVGINQTSPGYDLDVNGQVRVQDKLRVGNVNSGNGVVHMSSTATINPSATTIVWSQNVSVGMCAFIEYYILNNNTTTDQRAGTIMVTWNQSGTPTIAHTETTTPDIGSTIAVNFTSSLVGSDARINAVNSSSAPYTIVMNYRYF